MPIDFSYFLPKGRIKLTHIEVSNKSKHSQSYLSEVSITSNRSVSGSDILSEMTSTKNIHNLLIDVGSGLKHYSRVFLYDFICIEKRKW